MESNLIPRWRSKKHYSHHSLCFMHISFILQRMRFCHMEDQKWAQNQMLLISSEQLGQFPLRISSLSVNNRRTYCGTHSQRKHISFYPDLYEKIQREDSNETRFPRGLDNAPHSHFSVFSECEQEPLWSHGLIFQPSGDFPNMANFTKMGKQQRSAWALPSVAERLDSRCCWQRFYSEAAPPCRLCDGSPVCCVGALPPGHNSARGILHTIALLFGCHLCTVYTWPH